MVTVDEKIDDLETNGNNVVGIEIEDGYYNIYYVDSSDALHKLQLLVNGEEIVKEISDTVV